MRGSKEAYEAAKVRRAGILEMYNSGLNTCKIAAQLGITRERVRQILEKTGQYKRRIKYKPTKEERARDKFNSKVTNFWNNVDQNGGADSCWEWKATRLPAGYGHLRFFKNSTYAHRVAWILTNGDIPEGLCVCHTCDNPACCNPNHLWLGTHADNMHDRDAKGRGRYGKKSKKLAGENG